MVGFKKREIVYRPFEIVFKIITDIVMIICFTYLIVIAFFDKITITGHSMNNTLQNNQTVILNTIAYSLKAPERYDLIAFKTGKKDNTSIYVRRVIGLPGETVQIQDGKIYIDGKELTEDICNEDIYNAGSSDIYVVRTSEGKQILLPAIKDVIKNVDLEGGKITVHLIPGLI